MNVEALVERFRHDPRVQAITEKLRDTPPQNLHLGGLVGSIDSFIGAAVFLETGYNHLFVLTEKEEAIYFQNTLKGLLEKKDILLFPDSFKKPGKLEHINNNDILLRTETVNRIANRHTSGELIVTYPEALFEKVVKTETLEQNTIQIKIKEKLDVDFIIEVLVTYGFERVDFVYEPGQFSVRGGIIDIFSFGNELPYRVELFDDEVESIRIFNPVDQLSTKKISQVTIVPNMQTHFGLEQKTSFVDVLPENTILWFKDLSFTLDIIEACFKRAVQIYQALKSNNEMDLDSENLFFEAEPAVVFETSNRILKAIEPFHKIEFGGQGNLRSDFSLQLNTSPQPTFNKNFELLIENLKKNTGEGYTNYICAENPKQIERFYHIFEDLSAEVEFQPIITSVHQGFIDHDLKVACYTDHQIFDRYHKYKTRQGFSKNQALIMKTLQELSPGDFVTHIDYGVGRYSGLEKIEVNGHTQEAVRLIYKDNDLLYVNINALHKISKFVGKEGKQPTLNKLGTDAWESLKRKTKKKIKDIAEELIKLYAERKAKQGYAFAPDTYIQTELEASFIYEDTPDQEKATIQVKQDMESPHPMDRLVCGDVGFGKTEIAVRAATKAAADGKQVAVLAPTTILTLQHYKTFAKRLIDFPIEVDYLNRFKTGKEKKETLKKLEEGQTDIIVGTHALLGKTIKFKDLGLLIVDEEQKFGVGAKEKLRQLKVNVDTLTLTATPIPRTLQFSLMGARDLSTINTPPPNRQPIQTELHVFNDEIVREAIEYEIYRGGQVFFVHNRVKDIMDIAGMLKRLCPEIDFGIAHGQMEGPKLEEVMVKFENREYDVLVSTNIIESGLDIPNANTIIINNAHWFGLSDLHQMRGRVGRSNKKAFCYLFTPPLSALPSDTRKRLRTIEEFSDLGSGFNIAMRDLDIRGAGNLLGGEQSGFIAEIGYDTYHKILDETMRDLKQSKYKELYEQELEQQQEFVRDSQIDTDTEMHIPDNYVTNINERLALYTELNNVKTEEQLQRFKNHLVDRFGPLPPTVNELLYAMRLQWLAKKLGFERVHHKNNVLRCYFVEDQESYYYQTQTFGAILKYAQLHPRECRLKQTAKHLIFIIDKVKTLRQVHERLEHMHTEISEGAVA